MRRAAAGGPEAGLVAQAGWAAQAAGSVAQAACLAGWAALRARGGTEISAAAASRALGLGLERS